MSGRKLMFIITLLLVSCMTSSVSSNGDIAVDVTTRKVAVGKVTVTVQVATLPPGGWHPLVALGNNHVGGVEHLGDMAKRQGALLAVNGTFFNPEDYAKSNHLPTEPYGTLIREGKVLHVGNRGGVIAFDNESIPTIVPLRVSIQGGTAGSYSWPRNWYAYGFNHAAAGANANAAYIYTPEYGTTVGNKFGAKIVVAQGKIVDLVNDKDVHIPRDGYVIGLTGSEKSQLLSRFTIGLSVEYRTLFQGADKAVLPGAAINTAVGAGPILVSNGRILSDYVNQGFAGDKILTQRGRRTAIGIKHDGTVVVAIADNLFVQEMATVMQMLGAKDALNLDGGASSGMWANGKYIVTPGRKLSNALLFVPADGV